MRFITLIPFGFAAVCLALSVYAGMRDMTTPVAQQTFERPDVGENLLEPLELTTDQMYTVRLSSRIADGESSTVWASVTDIEGTPILELEDSYWSESGTWHEDGESGTWHESNSVTEFNFRVPEDGIYAMEVGVLGGVARPLRAEVLSSDPSPFNAVILGLLAVIFIILGVVVVFKRKPLFMKSFQRWGVGTEVDLEGDTWRVDEVWTYRDHYYRSVTSVTYVLRREGTLRTRYLSIERWELSAGDATKFVYVALVDVPLDEDEIESLEEKTNTVGLAPFTHRAKQFAKDTDNSGTATRRTTEGKEVEERCDVWRAGGLVPGTLVVLRTAANDEAEVEMARMVSLSDFKPKKPVARSFWEVPRNYTPPVEEDVG